MSELGALVDALPSLAFQAALLFCRIGAFVMLLPGIGEATVPTTMRLGFALMLVFVLLPGLGPALPPPTSETVAAALLITQEVLVGIWFGLLVRIAAQALLMAAQIIAFMMGISNVLVPDAALGGQGSPMSLLLGLAATAAILATGLYAIPLRALAESYAVLPVGAAVPLGAAAETIGLVLVHSLTLALRLAAPFVLVSLVIQLLGGLLGRVAPQTQAFILVMPAQILVCLLLLALLLPPILQHYETALREVWRTLPFAG